MNGHHSPAAKEPTLSRPTHETVTLQREFLQSMGTNQQFRHLFEHVPGIYFFVKDVHSQMICASRPILDRLGLEKEEDIVGTTDYDHFPPHVADSFVQDDQRVIRTGESLINRVEIWYNEQRLLDWFVTNKMPVRNGVGQVVGVMGTVRSFEGSKQAILPYAQISKVVEFIRENHRGKITVTELADQIKISPRQLHRRFYDAFGMSVQDFLTKTRIQATMDALVNSQSSILDIALEFGFCDQSAFTRQFKKLIGLTPFKFRQRHGKDNE